MCLSYNSIFSWFIIYFINDYRIYLNPISDNEIYYDIINKKKIKEEKEERFLIFPDDYPFESETFLGRHFPFLEFRKNKIRKKLRKYITHDGNYY